MSDRSTAILLTPPGGAAIAVVRLLGTNVRPFLAAHFSNPVIEGRCVHGTLSDGDRTIDDPVVVLDTNAAAADINVHGGPWVVRSVLDLARREDFEVVERPGLPLPEEAIDADTELAREVLCHLPMARTELAARVLLSQERAWRQFIAPLTQDEERAVRAVLEDRSLYWLLNPPRVAIIGVPNVGKSTLANQLFAQERSITADLPGTTRDWVGEVANVDGLAVMLLDTPGLRATSDPIEREAIVRGRGEIDRADLVVLVLDPTQPPDEQLELIRAHPGAMRVTNKTDVRARWEVPVAGTVRTVATLGEGVDALRGAIKQQFLGVSEPDIDRPRWWTDRQRAILERAVIDPEALSRI